jgi:hypothetical protein
MEWASLLTGTLTSAASGGILGFLGSAVGGVMKYFQTRQQHKHEQAKWAHEAILLDKEHARNREEDEHELTMLSEQGSWEGLNASIQSESGIGDTYKWVNAIRALFRPALTTGLVVIAFIIFKDLSAMLTTLEPSAFTGILTPEEARALLVYDVNALVFSASTAVVWWFGDRAFAPPGMKNR